MKKTITVFSFLILLFSNFSIAQIYDDYIGAGHIDGLTITSSDDQSNASSSVC